MLQKLTIISFATDDFAQGGLPKGIYSAMFNPESFEVDYLVNYNDQAALNQKGSVNRIANRPGKTFQFSFLLDDTGAAGSKRNIPLDVLHFRQVVGHGPGDAEHRYLTLVWGTFLADCVIDSFKVSYELFSSGGMPIRAKINATFREHTSGLASLLNSKIAGLLDSPIGDAFNIAMSATAVLNAAGAGGLNSLR